MCFGKRLEQLRKEKKINQSELAGRIGLTQQTISSYEKGKNKPSMDILVRLAQEFGVTSDYLLHGNVANNESELTDEQKEFLNVFEKISKDKRDLAKNILNTFVNK